MNNSHSLEQLQAHPTRPAAEARVVVHDFVSAMRLQQPAPAKMPEVGGGNVNAGEAWRNAIEGKGPQFIGLADTRDAARQWQGQAFVSDEESARKAIVAKALADRDARLAAAATAAPTPAVELIASAAPAIEAVVAAAAAAEVPAVAPAIEQPVTKTTKRSWGTP